MSGIQLVAIVFAAAMVFLTYNSYRRRELRGYEFALWMAIWIGLALISAFPDRVRGLIVPLRIVRLLDLVVIAGLLGISSIVFMLNRRVRRLEDRVAGLVRNLALDQSEPGGGGGEPAHSSSE